MAIALHWADFVIFGSFLGICAIIGPIQMWRDRHKKTSADSYFLAKKLHIIPTSASLFASFFSATGIISMPLELYMGGAKFFMATFGQFIGIFVGAFLFVPMFYRLKVMSSFQYYELRFRSPALRKVGTVLSVIASTFQLALVTFSPCISLEYTTGVPVWMSASISAAVTIFYTVLGGIKTVVVVDFLQAFIMFAGVLMATIVGFSKIDGGFSRAIEVAQNGGRLDFFDFNPDPRNTYSFYATVFPPIIGAAQIFTTTQASIQRYSSLPTVKQAMGSVMMLAPQSVLMKLLLFFLSIAMFAHYDILGCDPIRGGILKNRNQMVSHYMSEILIFPGLQGLWYAALFSGSLSTMSTMYNSIAAIIWADLLKEPLSKRLSPRGIHITIKMISLVIAVTSVCLAVVFEIFTASSSITRLARGTVSVFGAPLFIAFMSGVFLPFSNSIGTVCGMISAVIVSAFLSTGQLIYKRGGNDISWLPTNTTNCPNPKALGFGFNASNYSTIITGTLLLTSPATLILGESQAEISTLIPSNSSHFTTNLATSFQEFSNLTTTSTTKFATSDLDFLTILPTTNQLFETNSTSLGPILNLTLDETPLKREVRSVTNATLPGNVTSASEVKPQKQSLRVPPALDYIFSLSFYLNPLLSLIFGMTVAALVSLCFGGLKSAPKVDPGHLVVKNCFRSDEDRQADAEKKMYALVPTDDKNSDDVEISELLGKK